MRLVLEVGKSYRTFAFETVTITDTDGPYPFCWRADNGTNYRRDGTTARQFPMPDDIAAELKARRPPRLCNHCKKEIH